MGFEPTCQAHHLTTRFRVGPVTTTSVLLRTQPGSIALKPSDGAKSSGPGDWEHWKKGMKVRDSKSSGMGQFDERCISRAPTFLQIRNLPTPGKSGIVSTGLFLVRFRALCNGPPEPCQVRKEAALRGPDRVPQVTRSLSFMTLLGFGLKSVPDQHELSSHCPKMASPEFR